MGILTPTINKIYKKLDSIAKKGPTNYVEYYNYIDDLVNNNQYSLFEDTMSFKYNIEISRYPTIQKVKEDTFSMILMKTTSYFQDNLASLFNNNGVYQMGTIVYQIIGTTSSYLGQLTVTNVVEQVPYPDYVDKGFAEKTDMLTQNLNLTTINGTMSTIYGTAGSTLLTMYAEAIAYLKGVPYVPPKSTTTMC